MEEIAKLTNECLSCLNPRCKSGCPCSNSINLIISALKNGDENSASSILFETNPLPEYTSFLCDSDKQCQGHCIKGIRGNAVSIQQIERYIASKHPYQIKPGKPNGKKVAIIGAGIASISAAIRLIEAGFALDIYEKSNKIGGAVLTGIPDFRFDKSKLDNTHSLLEKAGAKFHFGIEVGKDIDFDDIHSSYDKVIVAIGAQKENLGGFETKVGYIGGLTLLNDINILGKANEYKNKYHKTLVWGGGNVALDCARSLKRIMGDVTIVYRRGRNEMPASDKEIESALNEGVKFSLLTNIKDVLYDDSGKVIGAKLIKMELGEKDESGRASFKEIDGSSYDEDCDLIIAAIGQKVDFNLIKQGLEKLDNHLSSIPNVYIAGDAYLGPKTVAACIRDGIEVAKEIIKDHQ